MTNQDNELMQEKDTASVSANEKFNGENKSNNDTEASHSVTFLKGSLRESGSPENKPSSSSQKGDARTARMGTGSIPKLIIEFAIPSIVGMLVNGAYNVIDSIFLGQAMGELVFQLQQQQCRS